MAAVENFGDNDNYKDLRLSGKGDYFNSGVLLINSENWIKQKISEKSIQYIHLAGDNLVWWDQDALNYSIKGKWLKLDKKFNFQEPWWNKDVDGTPIVLHFVGKIKPWHVVSENHKKLMYLRYVNKLPLSFGKVALTAYLYLGMLLRSVFNIVKIIYV